mmetsp:Transcript_24324/g.37500  ORF Transcript_24324/g.37500 Transcript_24324/m.37500 type:complete len:131 (-) Transcript_24324:1061-1453(-)
MPALSQNKVRTAMYAGPVHIATCSAPLFLGLLRMISKDIRPLHHVKIRDFAHRVFLTVIDSKLKKLYFAQHSPFEAYNSRRNAFLRLIVWFARRHVFSKGDLQESEQLNQIYFLHQFFRALFAKIVPYSR